MLTHDYFESITFSSGKNFNVSRRVDTSFMGRLHWHPFVEILVSLAGENEVSINFKKYALGLNDILIVYPGDLHAIKACTEGSILVIQFSSELLTIIHELNSSMPLLTQYPHIPYDPGASSSDRFVLLIKSFCEAFESDAAFKEVHMYSLLLSFFELTAKRCMRIKAEDSQEVSSAKNKTIKKMAEACLYISQNCTMPLTLDDVADFIGVSKSHFAHLFKEYTNITFVDFLTEERVKRAQTLLPSTDIQIIDIAFDSGFSSISSFNRAFKKVTGLSPSEFRKTMLGQQE